MLNYPLGVWDIYGSRSSTVEMFCPMYILLWMDVVEGYICAVPVCACKSFNLDYWPKYDPSGG
jgi:hypothetical protein